jgi:MerR family transcriptional regulator/heat shock protein HspR
MNREPRYSISVAAEITGLHPQTLRMYESRGLGRPRRTSGGTRRFSDSDIERLRKVVALTSEWGMNLAGVARVLELEDTVESLNRQVARLENQMFEAAQQLQNELAQVHRSYRRDLVPYQQPQHPELWTFRS